MRAYIPEAIGASTNRSIRGTLADRRVVGEVNGGIGGSALEDTITCVEHFSGGIAVVSFPWRMLTSVPSLILHGSSANGMS